MLEYFSLEIRSQRTLLWARLSCRGDHHVPSPSLSYSATKQTLGQHFRPSRLRFVCGITHKQGEGLLVLGHLLFGEGISLEDAMVSEVQRNSVAPHCGGLIFDNATHKLR